MIDTWLFAALVLGFLALCAILRAVPARTMDDRLVGGSTAVTLAAMAALALSIGWGNLFILDIAIILALCCFAVLIGHAHYSRGAPS
jgi:multisubunit Na+/H+ antiporter MnhF subunit